MLGGVVIERKEHVQVVGDLRDRLRPLGAVLGGERCCGPLGVLAVFGLPDLGEGGLGAGWADLGRALRTLAILWNQQRCSRVSGNTSRTAFQKPSAPSPAASTGEVIPRRLQSRSRSAHDSHDSRWPSAKAISSLVPSARTPIITSRHTLSWVRRTLRWIPSTHMYT